MIVIKRILKPENDFWLALIIVTAPVVCGILINPPSPGAAIAIILFGYFILAMSMSMMIGVVIARKREKKRNNQEPTK